VSDIELGIEAGLKTDLEVYPLARDMLAMNSHNKNEMHC
jgi:hypothetical protein